jgi:hypothetical protein
MTEPYSDLWGPNVPEPPSDEIGDELVLKTRFIEGDLQRLQVKKGDTFVLMVDEVLSMDHQVSILRHWDGLFPGTKLLVLPRGYRLGIVEGLK